MNVKVKEKRKAESGNRKAEKGEGVRGLGFRDGGRSRERRQEGWGQAAKRGRREEEVEERN